MVEFFDEKTGALQKERELIREEIVNAQEELQRRKQETPAVKQSSLKQFINQRSEVEGRLSREISILKDIRVKFESAQQEGKTITPEEQERFFGERAGQVESQLRASVVREEIIKGEQRKAREEPRLKEEVTITQLPPKTIGREEIQARRDVRERERQEKGKGIIFLKPSELEDRGIVVTDPLREKTETEIRAEKILQEVAPLFKEEKIGGFALGTGVEQISRVEAFSLKPIGREIVIQAGLVPLQPTPSEIERVKQIAVLRDISFVLVGAKFRSLKPTRVTFTGVQQNVKTNKIVTRITFLGERGTQIQRGVAQTVSRIIPRGEGFIVKSVTKGQRFRNVIELPTGKLIRIKETKFAGAEVSVVKTVGDKAISLGVGRLQKEISSARLIAFKSLSIAKQRGKKIGIVSGASVGGENIIARGIITRIPRQDTRSFRISSGKPSGIGIQTAKQIALASTQTAITGVLTSAQPSRIAIVQLAPKIITPSKTQVQIQTPKQQVTSLVSQPQIAQPQIQTPKISTFQRTGQQLKMIQPTAQVPRTAQLSLTTQKNIVSPKITPSLRQPLAQRISQAPRISTALKSIPKGFPTTPVPVPTIPSTPPRFPSFKFRPSRAQRQAGIFGVQVRRGGKFRTIATGLSLKQAKEIGTQRVGRTLGATFKITSPSGRDVSGISTPKGFRRKKGGLFIEKKELRLSTRGEIKEIQTARIRT